MRDSALLKILLIAFVFFGCSSKDKKETSQKEVKNSYDEPSSIIAGKIINRQVYPHINVLKLTIPDFEGNQKVYTSEINELGEFKFKIHPITNREIKLYPIEDIIVIAPGDSIYIVKDFKSITTTSFSGDRASLNGNISSFRNTYLGRYPTDYQQDNIVFKNYCDKEKSENYRGLIEFQKKHVVTDEFNNWVTKKIEFDYCAALFHYSFQHYLRTKQKNEDPSKYYSFINELETHVDNSVVMSDYFEISYKFVGYQLKTLRKKYQKEIEQKDTINHLIIKDIFSTPTNNYLAQLSVCTYFHSSLKANRIKLVQDNIDWINAKIKNPFLKKNLEERYNRVLGYNKNPKPFSDAILGNTDLELNPGVELENTTNVNLVKKIIAENRGKVVYIDFWSVWCPPCLYYMKHSKQLMLHFAGKEVEFVFVCINSKEDAWNKKLEELKIGGSHFYCNVEESRAIKKRFKFSGVPYYLLVNKEGVVVDYGLHLSPQGEYVKEELEKLIKE